jgi:hypothetical protein
VVSFSTTWFAFVKYGMNHDSNTNHLVYLNPVLTLRYI